MTETKNTLPNIAILSLFRDSQAWYIERYYQQIAALDYPPEKLKVYLVEGDSVNSAQVNHDLANMAQKLVTLDIKATKIIHNTGNAYHKAIINPMRMSTLAKTANAGLQAISDDRFADKILLLESDLLYSPDLILKLLETEKDVIAPLIMARDAFYDIWGFRTLDGQMTTPTFHQEVNGLTELSSVGSIYLFPAEPIYKGMRYPEEDCAVGMCRQLRKVGYKIWTTNIIANHPV
jgi:hypothetical protein